MKGALSTDPRTCPPGSHSNPLCRVQSHEYINICLVYWTVIFHGEAKKGSVPSEIQRLNPSLGSRQYSERSIKACLPDVPFRSCTYTSIEIRWPPSDPASRLCYLVRCNMNLSTSLYTNTRLRGWGWMKWRTRFMGWIFLTIRWDWQEFLERESVGRKRIMFVCERGVFRILESIIDQCNKSWIFIEN